MNAQKKEQLTAKEPIHYDLDSLKHITEGECADIYEIDEKTVLKLSKPGWSREDLYTEYRNGRLISESGVAAPKIYDFVEQDGRYGFTMEKLRNFTVIDWLFACKGDPMADVAGSWLIDSANVSELGKKSRLSKKLYDLGTQLLANVYLKRYLELTGKNRTDVMKWIPICAAKYVDIGLPEAVNRRFLRIIEKHVKRRSVQRSHMTRKDSNKR